MGGSSEAWCPFEMNNANYDEDFSWLIDMTSSNNGGNSASAHSNNSFIPNENNPHNGFYGKLSIDNVKRRAFDPASMKYDSKCIIFSEFESLFRSFFRFFAVTEWK